METPARKVLIILLAASAAAPSAGAGSQSQPELQDPIGDQVGGPATAYGDIVAAWITSPDFGLLTINLALAGGRPPVGTVVELLWNFDFEWNGHMATGLAGVGFNQLSVGEDFYALCGPPAATKRSDLGKCEPRTASARWETPAAVNWTIQVGWFLTRDRHDIYGFRATSEGTVQDRRVVLDQATGGRSRFVIPLRPITTGFQYRTFSPPTRAPDWVDSAGDAPPDSDILATWMTTSGVHEEIVMKLASVNATQIEACQLHGFLSTWDGGDERISRWWQYVGSTNASGFQADANLLDNGAVAETWPGEVYLAPGAPGYIRIEYARGTGDVANVGYRQGEISCSDRDSTTNGASAPFGSPMLLALAIGLVTAAKRGRTAR